MSCLPASRDAAHTCSLFSGIFADSCSAGPTISSVSYTHTHSANLEAQYTVPLCSPELERSVPAAVVHNSSVY